MAKREQSTILTTGFGEKNNGASGRYYSKNGSPNILRKGVPFFDRFSWYHTMIELPRWKFWLALLLVYISVNIVFALVYYLIGMENFNGVTVNTTIDKITEAFFFSTQTFSTVGYGHVSPSGVLTSAVASFEAFLGVLSFALASGLFYGRFSKPRSFLRFSDVAVIAPFKGGRALMFRTVPYKNNHLMDAEVKLTLGLRVKQGDEIRNVFYGMDVEFQKINSLILNWTIVHPINEDSPLWGMGPDELRQAHAEILVFIKAYDEVFSNTVVARSSYTAHEILWGAKFLPMYHSSPEGDKTVLHVNHLNHLERVELPALKQPDESE